MSDESGYGDYFERFFGSHKAARRPTARRPRWGLDHKGCLFFDDRLPWVSVNAEGFLELGDAGPVRENAEGFLVVGSVLEGDRRGTRG